MPNDRSRPSSNLLHHERRGTFQGPEDHVFQNFKISQKLAKHSVFATFQITKILITKYSKITKIIQVAPLRGAIGIEIINYLYVFCNFESCKKWNVWRSFFKLILRFWKSHGSLPFISQVPGRTVHQDSHGTRTVKSLLAGN